MTKPAKGKPKKLKMTAWMVVGINGETWNDSSYPGTFRLYERRKYAAVNKCYEDDRIIKVEIREI